MDDPTDGRWTATTRAVFDRLDTVAADAVATIVDVEGRAYRRPGAKMLVSDDGETVSAVTPGCLEGPLVDVAADVLATGEPSVETYDLTDDDGWGLGLGCRGVVTVLVEPADESLVAPVRAVERGESRTVLTAIGGDACPIGSRSVVGPNGSLVAEPAEAAPPGEAVDDVTGAEAPANDDVTGAEAAAVDEETRAATSGNARDPLPDRVREAVERDAASLAGTGRARTRTVETAAGDATVLLDGLRPPNRLVVFGSGPDVRPVARIAREAGFAVTVATGRSARADASHVPAADQVVATRPDDLGALVDDRTAVVCMSHNFVDDRLAFGSVLETAAPYIGIMGPRDRFRRLRDELREDGTTLSASDRERIAAPVGLDLGGGEPAEIALSVVSEALAALNDRGGGRLRDRAEPIHDRTGSE